MVGWKSIQTLIQFIRHHGKRPRDTLLLLEETRHGTCVILRLCRVVGKKKFFDRLGRVLATFFFLAIEHPFHSTGHPIMGKEDSQRKQRQRQQQCDTDNKKRINATTTMACKILLSDCYSIATQKRNRRRARKRCEAPPPSPCLRPVQSQVSPYLDDLELECFSLSLPSLPPQTPNQPDALSGGFQHLELE